MKQSIKLFVAVLSLLTISLVSASTPVGAAPNDPVSIPDAGLSACILATTTHANPSYLTEAEAANVPNIGYPYGQCRSQNISSLEGLQYFTSANYMMLGSNNISDLTPLANLSNLRDLELSNNKVTNITPLTNLDLTRIDISYTGTCSGLSLAPLSGMTSLLWLDVRDCPLTNLSALSGLTNLITLYLTNSNISDISPLSGLASLVTLQLLDNPISDLSPIAGLAALNIFSVGGQAAGNRLLDNADFNVIAGLTSLTRLYIYGSQISNISPITSMNNLAHLSINNSLLVDISPLASLTDLVWLTLTYNNIGNISPLANLTSLGLLGLAHNNISSLSPVSGLTALTRLDAGNNKISDISPLATLTNLTEVYLSSQTVALSNATAGQPYANPFRAINGSFIPTSGSKLTYDTNTNTWNFTENGAQTGAWSTEITLGGFTGYFNGTFTQTQVPASTNPGDDNGDGSGTIPGVPNTGALRILTSGPAIYVVFGLALLATIVGIRKTIQSRR